MSRASHRAKGLVFKVIFSVIGLILFTAQVSYKFYRSASVPYFRAVHEQHAHPGYPLVSSKDGSNLMSLDKRFDLKLEGASGRHIFP